MRASGLSRCVAWFCAVGLLSAAVAGCGCGKRTPKADSLGQLRVTRLRWAQEPRKAVCYVAAEIENTGKTSVREVRVTATLLSGGGKSRGTNNAFLKDIKPGERRTLYMSVTTTGAFRRVTLSFHDPQEKG